MAVLTYKGGKYRNLAGNKVFDGSQWREMSGDSKIFLDGAWRDFSWQKAALPEIPDEPEIPDWDDFTHLHTEEPASGNVLYMTPAGSGKKDGSTWDNAFSASQLYVALLSSGENDRLYLAEGDYGTLTVPLTSANTVRIFGGFIEDDYSWETRDAFNHQTVFRGDGTMPFTAASKGTYIDGIAIENFAETVVPVYGTNMTVKDSSFTAQETVRKLLNSFTNCRFSGGVQHTILCNTASNCYFAGKKDDPLFVGTTTLNNSTVLRCSPTYYVTDIFGSPSTVSFLAESTSDSFFCDITLRLKAGDEPEFPALCYSASNTVFLRCKSNYAVYFICSGISGCVFRECEANITADANAGENRIIDSSVTGSFVNTVLLECSIAEISKTDSSKFINCTTGSIGTTERSKFINCTIDSANKAIASLVVNSAINNGPVASCVGCTFVNSIVSVEGGSNTVFWNNNGTINPDGNAQSAYDAGNTLTLGRDNTISRFVSTGYAPAVGVQDIGECPNPIDDPEGFEDYVSSFGDWHPRNDSFLVGNGSYRAENRTDLDGVTRADPPSLGAYEPVPEVSE